MAPSLQSLGPLKLRLENFYLLLLHFPKQVGVALIETNALHAFQMDFDHAHHVRALR